MTSALLFPGQGSQHVGMGRDLFDRHRGIEETADEVLGRPVRRLCLEDPDGLLRNTRYAQPAIFVVNAMAAVDAHADHGPYDLYAGHSLGEWNALVAAGHVALVDALRAVVERGRLMAEAGDGAMAAVLGLPPQEVERVVAAAGLGRVRVANRNSDRQTVIAGDQDHVAAAGRLLLAAGADRVSPLPVSGAFHTPAMAPARRAMAAVLRTVTFHDGTGTVLSSTDGRPFDVAGAARSLSRQITAPVDWIAVVHALRDRGATRPHEVNGRTLLALFDATAPAGA